ncbi:MAG: PepSY domain-containing protein [Actinoplanes sp.]
MKTVKLRSKRVIVATAATVVALGIGGAVWASAAQADDVTGSERDRVGNAAVQAVGGGTALDVETEDNGSFEAEVRKADGTEVDVTLDKDLKVITQTPDAPDADDRVLNATERASAEKAALDAVGGGTIIDVEAGDNGSYEVEVRKTDNTEWDVELDAAFKVLTKSAD